MAKKSLVILILCLSVSTLFAGSGGVSSPDGRLAFNIVSENGSLYYEIAYNGRPVILRSELGISAWDSKLSLDGSTQRSVDETWHPVYGERAQVRDCFNEKTFVVKREGRGDRLHIIVRAYNEGIAFRYHFAGNGYFAVDKENTEFRVPPGTHCWFAPFAQADYTYLPVKDWPGEAERPLTMKLADGTYVCLAEAEMVNYSRTKFYVKKGEENIIRCRMYDRVEEVAPFGVPWRVVMVADKPADLLANNDIILNLNQPCRIEDTSWIKPGKVIRSVSLTTEGAKKVVAFAVERNLDYIHLDAGWYGAETSRASDPRKSEVDPERSPVNDLDVPELVRYARSRGVGVWLYVNQRALSEHLDEILPLYKSWGVAGIKFGFVHVGSFRWTTWLHEAVKKCAAHELMVDIHDEYRPTGFSRTYPNLLTQEGVRGNEEFPDGITNTTLPFTRFIAGAADATVCYYHYRHFKPGLPETARTLMNTPCHQMALSVINYSPLQFLYWYDTPEDAQGEPELEFFDRLHTVWDDTKIINGEIGEYISVARKKEGEWFVGCITNNDARKIEVPLDFLDNGEKYEATMYTDGGRKVKTRTGVAVTKKTVDSNTVLKLDIEARGGAAMIISKKPR